MKMRTRLIIAFCLTAVLPAVLMICVGYIYVYPKWKSAGVNYVADSGSVIAGASLKAVVGICDSLEKLVLAEAEEDSERFTDTEYLKELDRHFKDKNSYMVVMYASGECIYCSEGASYDVVSSAVSKGEQNTYTFAREEEQIYKFVDLTSGGKALRLYIFTDLDQILPEVRQLSATILVLLGLILITTSVLMVAWISRSMIRPMNALSCAARNIRDGNYDFEVPSSEDEMGVLMADLDALRFRLQESEELKKKHEEANRVLISNISHDLKTPITTIKGYAQGLLEGVANTPEKRERYLKTIAVKADDMTRLIEQLTLLSDTEDGNVTYDFEEIKVSDYFEDLAYDYKNELEAEGIDFSYSNYASEGAAIRADARQLKRVLNNIISNSVKYMNKKNKSISMRISEKTESILVEVEDNGTGIAATELPRIFDRFYRTDASRHGPSAGSGIGLAIVKKIVTEHDGRVWASSRENTGTVMHIELPKIKEEQI